MSEPMGPGTIPLAAAGPSGFPSRTECSTSAGTTLPLGRAAGVRPAPDRL